MKHIFVTDLPVMSAAGAWEQDNIFRAVKREFGPDHVVCNTPLTDGPGWVRVGTVTAPTKTWAVYREDPR